MLKEKSNMGESDLLPAVNGEGSNELTPRHWQGGGQRFENSIFHAVFAGWDGKRVASTEPMTALRRVEYLGGVALGILIETFGGAYGANSSALALTGITIGLGSVLSGYFGLKVLEGQRVGRGG